MKIFAMIDNIICYVANIEKIYSLILTLAFAYFCNGTSFQSPYEGIERNCFLRNIGS